MDLVHFLPGMENPMDLKAKKMLLFFSFHTWINIVGYSTFNDYTHAYIIQVHFIEHGLIIFSETSD